jgi:hypothetical protein
MKHGRHGLPVLVCALLVTAACADDGWEILFNGNDLAGWRALTDQGAFTVEDGAIRAHAKESRMDHLYYVGGQQEGYAAFRNFELDLFARGEPNSNSGIFIHADMSTRGTRRYLDTGYEIQLNSTEKEKRKTGSLYDVVDLDTSPVDEATWFRVNIKVIDKHISVHINGEEVVVYTEPANPVRSAKRQGRVLRPGGGAIALQAHDPDSVFYFRDIRIKRLP